MKNKKVSLAGLALVLAILACNVPGTSQPLTLEQQAGTAIAATLTAQPSESGSSTATATATFISLTGTPGSTATTAGTVTITPTYSTPMLTVLEQTNCREGPGQDYQVVFTYLAKVKLEIIGRYEPTNFWLVKSPGTKTGTCWMWGEYTEASGSYWVVPTLTPPPTATSSSPAGAFDHKVGLLLQWWKCDIQPGMGGPRHKRDRLPRLPGRGGCC